MSAGGPAAAPVGPVPVTGRVIGVDLGERRVGVAASDDAQRVAAPSGRIDRTADRSATIRALAALVDDYGAVGVVVGLPRSLSGAVGPAAVRVLREVEDLRAALAVPVDTVDERLTTVTAAAGLRAGGRRAARQRGVIDQAAAAELLQTWLDARRGPDRG